MWVQQWFVQPPEVMREMKPSIKRLEDEHMIVYIIAISKHPRLPVEIDIKLVK